MFRGNFKNIARKIKAIVQYLEDTALEEDDNGGTITDEIKRTMPVSVKAAEIRKIRTVTEVRKMMRHILREFDFTTEMQSDYDDNFIPTLDTKLRMEIDGSISYRFFEKEMASRYCMMESAAISANSQNNSMTQ